MSETLKFRESGQIIYSVCATHMKGPPIEGCIICSIETRLRKAETERDHARRQFVILERNDSIKLKQQAARIATLRGLIEQQAERIKRLCLLTLSASPAREAAGRYRGLIELMKARNVHLNYHDRTHEIAGPTFVLSDLHSGETLGYGSTVDAAIDAVFARTAGCREQTAPRQSGTKPCVR